MISCLVNRPFNYMRASLHAEYHALTETEECSPALVEDEKQIYVQRKDRSSAARQQIKTAGFQQLSGSVKGKDIKVGVAESLDLHRQKKKAS